MRNWQLDLDGDEHAPRLARHSVGEWLDLVACDEDTKTDVILVVSELVAGAVTSRAASVSVRMVFDDGRLRVDVLGRRGQPSTAAAGDRPPPDASSPALIDRIIDAASDAWGRTSTSEGTDTWAEILC